MNETPNQFDQRLNEAAARTSLATGRSFEECRQAFLATRNRFLEIGRAIGKTAIAFETFIREIAEIAAKLLAEFGEQESEEDVEPLVVFPAVADCNPLSGDYFEVFRPGKRRFLFFACTKRLTAAYGPRG